MSLESVFPKAINNRFGGLRQELALRKQRPNKNPKDMNLIKGLLQKTFNINGVIYIPYYCNEEYMAIHVCRNGVWKCELATDDLTKNMLKKAALMRINEKFICMCETKGCQGVYSNDNNLDQTRTHICQYCLCR